MISQFTWPNFRAGSDKDGTGVLIEERNFAHDVKYGKTKIFIRSPATLFALETVRLYGITYIYRLIELQLMVSFHSVKQQLFWVLLLLYYFLCVFRRKFLHIHVTFIHSLIVCVCMYW
jgi:hypothetical protein